MKQKETSGEVIPFDVEQAEGDLVGVEGQTDDLKNDGGAQKNSCLTARTSIAQALKIENNDNDKINDCSTGNQEEGVVNSKV